MLLFRFTGLFFLSSFVINTVNANNLYVIDSNNDNKLVKSENPYLDDRSPNIILEENKSKRNIINSKKKLKKKYKEKFKKSKKHNDLPNNNFNTDIYIGLIGGLREYFLEKEGFEKNESINGYKEDINIGAELGADIYFSLGQFSLGGTLGYSALKNEDLWYVSNDRVNAELTSNDIISHFNYGLYIRHNRSNTFFKFSEVLGKVKLDKESSFDEKDIDIKGIQYAIGYDFIHNNNYESTYNGARLSLVYNNYKNFNFSDENVNYNDDSLLLTLDFLIGYSN